MTTRLFRPSITDLLPKRFEGLGGLVRVDRPLVVSAGERRHEDAVQTRGCWRPLERRVVVGSTLPRRSAWLIFWHEVGHSWLDDSGVHAFLSDRQQEGVCEAVASGLIRLMEGRS